MQINLPILELRDYQKPQFTARKEGCTRFYKVWHRRAGKDLTDINFTIMQMMERKGNYWHMLPEYNQARKAIWRGKTAKGMPYIDYFPRELIKSIREQEMMIELINGSTWQLVGSDTIDSLRGASPVGIVMSEYAFTNPNAWPTIEPILMENNGWVVFNTTPYGENHAYQLWKLAEDHPKWFTQKLTIEDTSIVTTEQIEELRSMGTTDETIQREYYCSWQGSIEGAYYSDVMKYLDDNNLITNVPYDPQHPVSTYWDIGISDYTTIWFVQRVGREFWIIDYYQDNGRAVTDYGEYIDKLPYKYDTHNLPHDAGYRQLATGKSIKQQLADLMPNHKFRVLQRTNSVQSDIMATRSFLKRCVFDKKRCYEGLDALRSYSKKWSDKKNCFEDKPLHNWASHGADGFRYLATDLMDKNHIDRPAGNENGLPTFDYMLSNNGANRSRRRI